MDGVVEAYRAILGRDPDPSGISAFGGMSPLRIERALIASKEFADRPFLARAMARWHHARQRPTAADIRWFHSLELPEGTTPGVRPTERLRQEFELVFAHPVAQRKVLDIGAWDGAFSFEAERRGAADVLSTDWYCWSGPGWGTKEGYDYAHAALRSRCRSLDVDLFDLDPARLGTFDDVLFLGVIYHLKDPLGGLAKAAAMSRDHLVVETPTIYDDDERPLLFYAPGFGDDPTNYFIPNQACLVEMLRSQGFPKVEILPTIDTGGLRRHVLHAWRGQPAANS